MRTPPRRRWFQFSLATMFVVVTLVAVLAWYFGEPFRNPPIEIIGRVPTSEVRAISLVVAPSTFRTIDRIELVAPGHVKVTIFERQGGIGNGSELEMKKQNGRWIIVRAEPWVGSLRSIPLLRFFS